MENGVQELAQLELYRYTNEAENELLKKIAKKDAWANLKQWFFPALGLSFLVLAYWLYRTSLQELLQGTKNPSEYRVFINLVLNFFVLLLHLVLVLYTIRLLQTLRHFGRHSAMPSDTSEAVAETCAIYVAEGEPDYDLSLVLTSRSGLRRYRWHYYLGELPITPLPQQRKVLPLFVQKKSWTNFAADAGPRSASGSVAQRARAGWAVKGKQRKQEEASAEVEREKQLEKAFPEQRWLQLSKECSALRFHVARLQYYDFQFYYLCAIGPVVSANEAVKSSVAKRGKNPVPKVRNEEGKTLEQQLAQLQKSGIPSTEENYKLLDQLS